MIIVTGGAGFIGSNLVKALNERGHRQIVIVDNFKDGRKLLNLKGLEFKELLQKTDFLRRLSSFSKIDAIFHLGACSSTKEWDGDYLFKNNYEYSKFIFDFCKNNETKLLYASSASVYGLGDHGFTVNPKCEEPINAYAWSKLLFDNYVRENSDNTKVAGFRFFNVYGKNEYHKDEMCSPVLHFYKSVKLAGKINLFGNYGALDGSKFKRDFVSVENSVDLLVRHFENRIFKPGIFNVGTGQASTFVEVAELVIKHIGGEIVYVDFPKELEGRYQHFTQADNAWVSEFYPDFRFDHLNEGVSKYLGYLSEKSNFFR